MYETVMTLRATATASDTQGDPLFLLELQYGVNVVLNNVPEEKHHPVLLIEIPRLAFHYVRQIVSDLTAQGGFPPLMVNPVDFQKLYMDRFKDEIAAAEDLAKTADTKDEKDDKKSKTKSDAKS